MTVVNDIVVTGMGVLTPAGHGLAEVIACCENSATRSSFDQYNLKNFKAAPFLTDKKMLKTVSKSDAIGLVAIEDLKKNAQIDGEQFKPERIGVYSGAIPTPIHDVEPYRGSMLATKDVNGNIQELEFGKTCMESMPTVLLVGLPNNVLCYGSIILDARGPNSNYTSMETSGHIAVMAGARKLAADQLDCAVVGSYSAHQDPFYTHLMMHNGLLKKDDGKSYTIDPFATCGGTIPADGAVYMSLEKEGNAIKRGRNILARYLGGTITSDGLGPNRSTEKDSALEHAITATLEKANLTPEQVGIVFLTGSGVEFLDQVEQTAVTKIFQSSRPALATLSRVTGNLMEAGGLLEVGLISHLYMAGKIPAPLAVTQFGNEWPTTVDSERPAVMVLRASAWREYSCLLFSRT